MGLLFVRSWERVLLVLRDRVSSEGSIGRVGPLSSLLCEELRRCVSTIVR